MFGNGGGEPSGGARSREVSPRDMAIQYLARREYSRAELVSRLSAKGVDGDDIHRVLGDLADEGLQSDARFAESFIRSRISRGQGLIRIKGELRQRGVDQETQAAALAAVEEREAVDWFELARETLERRFSTPGDSPKERAKRERFLAARGFDFEQILLR